MRISRWVPWVCGVGFALLATTLAESADPAADLKSKHYEVRLQAVKAIRAAGGEDAEKLLLYALKDKDWEVVERAVEGLGEHGGDKALKALVKVAAEGPVRRVRLAAAVSLAKIEVESAAKRLAKYLRKDEAVNAAEALGLLAQLDAKPEFEQLRKAVQKAMKSKEPLVRAATTGALDVFPAEKRVERFQKLLEDPHILVVAAALDQLRARPDRTHLRTVAALLAKPGLNDVLARRAIAAIDAIFVAWKPDAETDVFPVLEALLSDAAKDARASLWVARLIGQLGAAPPVPEEEADDKPADKTGKEGKDKKKEAPAPAPPPTVDADLCLRLLENSLVSEHEAARAEAVRSLGRIRTPKALDRAAVCLEDAHERVRLQALIAVVGGRGLQNEATFAQVAERLAKDKSAAVREQAAVLLGRSLPEGKPFDAPIEPLTKALSDETWSVAVVAAVSLGKTRAEAAVKPLAAMLDRKKVKDWRLRAAAVVGLGRVRQRAAVPHLIQALKDRDAWVKRNAYEFLRRLTKRTIYADFDEWTAWWKRFGPKYEFIDHEKIARQMRKGGYAVDPVDVYEKGKAALDVVVLQSRGDHIEKLLDDLRIQFRITRQAQVREAEVHSFCLFVSNCTGEIHKDDVERLAWFVRVGGYLFCSCWALRHTVVPVYPGIVRKLATKAEVLDNVMSEPCPGDSPFLDGVFMPWTRPIYVLFGSHLIEVLQPERVEVLIDSPQAAARWGGGNMAMWFRAGHGVILDSANHFDLQGLERVRGLKTAEDRMGYAMDHMGLDYPELRRLAASKVWDKQAEAAKQVRDLSAFRFITNFVRLKRKVDLK